MNVFKTAILILIITAFSIACSGGGQGCMDSGDSGKPADCEGKNLSEGDFQGYDLKNANLTKADLSGADLYGADLTGATCCVPFG